MSDEDDDLGIDLDAWQPPPVPGGIADAVVAQMRQEHTSVTTVTAVETDRRSRRIWLAAIPIVAAAAAGIVAFGIQRAPVSGRGTALAERPMHLSLGPSSAELDRSTQVTWQRERYRITATQHGGAATWRVDDDDTLTIDATLASIEATNASMRVEVKMIDAEQKRTIATSAVTAAAVALVTIVVYEGTVKVTDAEGNSRKVGAGATYEIKGPHTVIEEEAATVGASAPDLVAQIEDLDRQLEAKRKELAEAKQDSATNVPGVTDIMEFDVSSIPDSIGRKDIQREMGRLLPKARQCAIDVGFEGTVTVTMTVSRDGTVANVVVDPAAAPPAVCISDVMKTARFSKTKNVTTFKYPLIFKNMTKQAACDFDALSDDGKAAYSENQYAKALDAFEAAYRCRADTQTLKLAFAAACGARNVERARFYWAKLNESQRHELRQICVRNGISGDQLEAETGKLRVHGPSSSTIFVDGKRVGGSPVEVEVAPGKHKVTILVGDGRHSFVVNVRAGESVSLDKPSL